MCDVSKYELFFSFLSLSVAFGRCRLFCRAFAAVVLLALLLSFSSSRFYVGMDGRSSLFFLSLFRLYGIERNPFFFWVMICILPLNLSLSIFSSGLPNSLS